MILLGSAQTYFGVLLTLAVLQMFYKGKNSENYFLKLIEQMGNDILNVMKIYVKKVESYYKKQIKDFSPLYQEKLTVQLTKMQTQQINARSKLDYYLRLSTKDETPLFVALYSFLFGLVIMLLDPFWFESNFLVGFILYYITLSYSFTIVLWYMYIKAPRKYLNDPCSFYDKPDLKINNTCWYLVLVFTVTFILFSIIPFISIWIRMLITLVVFISMGMCLPFYRTVNYNRRFVFRHSLLIFLISLFGGFLYYVSPYSSYHSFYVENSCELIVLRFLLVTFMLGNLILVPLMIISVRHYKWKNLFIRKIKTEEFEFKESIKSYEQSQK